MSDPKAEARAHVIPIMFWTEFREALRRAPANGGKWVAYSSDDSWTPVAINAARDACKSLGLLHQKEYYRLDVIGYTRRSNQEKEFHGRNWDLRVAFEHENRDDWEDELCKLTHMAADLCVLVSYYKCEAATKKKLADAIAEMGDRMYRVPGRQWLFVFGPRCAACEENAEAAFKALTLGDDGTLVPLPDENPLKPACWKQASGDSSPGS